MMAGGSENRCLISTRNCCPPYTLDMLISERTATTARDFTLRVDPTPPATELLPKRGDDIGGGHNQDAISHHAASAVVAP